MPGQPTPSQRTPSQSPPGQIPLGQPSPGQTPPGQTPPGQPARRQQLTTRTLLTAGKRLTKPLASIRLPSDPDQRMLLLRAAVTLAVFIVFALWVNWRLGLVAAVLYAAIDRLFRSKSASVIEPENQVTAAQRSTSRRLKVLQAAGYLALNARALGEAKYDSDGIVDHLVVGPTGVYALDSERWDKRLPIRTIGGRLYLGPRNMEDRLKQARWEAQQAAALISAEIGRPIRVHPAMVVYGPRIPWVINKLQGVDVFDGGRVSTYFRRRSKEATGRLLNPDQINRLYAAAAHALPPAE